MSALADNISIFPSDKHIKIWTVWELEVKVSPCPTLALGVCDLSAAPNTVKQLEHEPSLISQNDNSITVITYALSDNELEAPLDAINNIIHQSLDDNDIENVMLWLATTGWTVNFCSPWKTLWERSTIQITRLFLMMIPVWWPGAFLQTVWIAPGTKSPCSTI